MTVIEEGNVGTKFYIIKRGTAIVYSKRRELGEIRQGAYFGQNAFTKKNKMGVTGKSCCMLNAAYCCIITF